jgi:hypothetical protein
MQLVSRLYALEKNYPGVGMGLGEGEEEGTGVGAWTGVRRNRAEERYMVRMAKLEAHRCSPVVDVTGLCTIWIK